MCENGRFTSKLSKVIVCQRHTCIETDRQTSALKLILFVNKQNELTEEDTILIKNL